jgi:hypothetical protein
MSKSNVSWGQKLQSLGSFQLYMLLMVVCSVPLFFDMKAPNRVDPASVALFRHIMEAPEDSVFIIQSDWTFSTRGENGGNMEALLRLVMHRGLRFVVYSGADPQAPQVARNLIMNINAERVAKGQRPYVRWEDYVDLGFLPDMGTMAIAMGADLRRAWGLQRDVRPDGVKRPIFESPVLRDIHRIEDIHLLVNIHAAATHIVLVQRLYGKVPIASMCTGVMVPEMVPYFKAGQIIGFSGGLKGVYDMEMLMEGGLNWRGPDGKIANPMPGQPVIAGFPGEFPKGRGSSYYPTLHFALGLLILAVVVGNVGIYLTRRETRARRK